MSEQQKLDHTKAPIVDAIEGFNSSGIVPFNVPGHKRDTGIDRLMKSMGAALVIGEINPVFIQPEINEEWNIENGVDPDVLEKTLYMNPDAKGKESMQEESVASAHGSPAARLRRRGAWNNL